MKVKYIAVVLLFLVLAISAQAETFEMSVQQRVQQNSQQKIQIQNNQRIKQEFNSDGVKSELSVAITGTAGTVGEVKDMRGMGTRLNEQIRKDLRQEFASREAQFDERVKQLRTLFQKEHEQFKEKLQTFRDENKKAAAENIDIMLQNVNTTRTVQMSKALEQLAGVLQGLQTKTEEAKSAGQDTATAQSKIDAASNAIAASQAIVAAQAGKSYTAEVTTESTIKNSMNQATTQLRTDLKKTQDSVQSARKSVIEAARAVYKLKPLTNNGTFPTTNNTSSGSAAF